jgi:hypothetical protein
VAELDDLLKERIAALKAERERTRAAMDRVRSEARPKFQIMRSRGRYTFRRKYLFC